MMHRLFQSTWDISLNDEKFDLLTVMALLLFLD